MNLLVLETSLLPVPSLATLLSKEACEVLQRVQSGVPASKKQKILLRNLNSQKHRVQRWLEVRDGEELGDLGQRVQSFS